jgi:multiple sugar transport system substrate-binding protein
MATSAARGFSRTLNFYLSMYDAAAGPTGQQQRESPMCGTNSRRGYFSFYITGPWNIGEFKRRLPAELQERVDDGTAARTFAGRVPPSAGGSSLALFRTLAAQGGGLEAWCSTCRGRRCSSAFMRLTGNLPPRRSAPGRVKRWQRDPCTRAAFGDQLERVAAGAAGAGVGAHRHRTARGAGSRWCTGTCPRAARMGEELDRRADRILEKRRWMLDRGGVA